MVTSVDIHAPISILYGVSFKPLQTLKHSPKVWVGSTYTSGCSRHKFN